MRDAGFRRQLRMLYGPATVYDVSIGLELDGQEFGSVRVGVSTVFLRNELTPKLQQAAFFSVVAIFCSLVLAAVVSNVALGPLEGHQPQPGQRERGRSIAGRRDRSRTTRSAWCR